jgi:hypothetical protein
LQRILVLRVSVDEVIKGAPQSDTCGVVDLLRDQPFGITLGEVAALMPTDESSLFILQNLGEQNQVVRAPAEEVDATRTIYNSILDEQSVIRNIEGIARPIVPSWSRAWFPGMFDGGPFADVVSAVRDEVAAHGSPAPSQIPCSYNEIKESPSGSSPAGAR